MNYEYTNFFSIQNVTITYGNFNIRGKKQPEKQEKKVTIRTGILK